jgi:hypothetical protein
MDGKPGYVRHRKPGVDPGQDPPPPHPAPKTTLLQCLGRQCLLLVYRVLLSHITWLCDKIHTLRPSAACGAGAPPRQTGLFQCIQVCM